MYMYSLKIVHTCVYNMYIHIYNIYIFFFYKLQELSYIKSNVSYCLTFVSLILFFNFHKYLLLYISDVYNSVYKIIRANFKILDN